MIRWTLSDKPDNCLLLYRLYIEYGKTARDVVEFFRDNPACAGVILNLTVQ